MFDFTQVDVSRGYDVIRANGNVVAHFDNYADAWAYAEVHHLTVRYWAAKVEGE